MARFVEPKLISITSGLVCNTANLYSRKFRLLDKPVTIENNEEIFS